MTQAERYHARRAMGQCALCPNTVSELKSGKQPWACFRCRLKMARFQRERRARMKVGPACLVFAKDGRTFQVDSADTTPEQAVQQMIAAGFTPQMIHATVHLASDPRS